LCGKKSIETQYTKKVHYFNRIIRHCSKKFFFYNLQGYSQNLSNTLYYVLLSRSKRIRGLLVCEFGWLLLNKNKWYSGNLYLYMAAFAIELLQTYSLLHDDLPAMDDDNWRRRRLSCHKCFGEDLGILTGDILLTEVFNVVSCLGNHVPKLVRELSLSSGEGGAIIWANYRFEIFKKIFFL